MTPSEGQPQYHGPDRQRLSLDAVDRLPKFAIFRDTITNPSKRAERASFFSDSPKSIIAKLHEGEYGVPLMVTNQATQETTLGGYVLTDNNVHFFIFNNGLVLRGIGINEKYLGGVSLEGIQNMNLAPDVFDEDGTLTEEVVAKAMYLLVLDGLLLSHSNDIVPHKTKLQNFLGEKLRTIEEEEDLWQKAIIRIDAFNEGKINIESLSKTPPMIFKGEMAEEISQWEKASLGKAVGTDHYAGIMYSIPLTYGEESFDPRVLLVVPIKDGSRYAVGRPFIRTNEIQPHIEQVKHNYLEKFTEHYLPSDEPFILPNTVWGEKDSQDPLGTFIRNASQTAIIVEEITDPDVITSYKSEAVQFARNLKRIREQSQSAAHDAVGEDVSVQNFQREIAVWETKFNNPIADPSGNIS